MTNEQSLDAAPLAGIRVVDFSHFIAGPICTMLLADMGAEVIKIENVAAGDDLRRFPPQLEGQSSAFLWTNRNKLGLALDLKQEEGIEIARQLIASADVLVENFSSGVMERFGLGYPALSEINPRLIYCSISAYGREGALAGRAGFDPMIQAETGFMSLNGFPDGPEMRTGPAVMDISTGMMATIATLGALTARERTGRGQRAEVCLFDVATLMLGFHAMNYLVSGKNPTRFGNNSADSAPTGVFNAADGPLYIACANDRTYQRLVSALQRADLADHADFSTNADRARNRQKLAAIIDGELGKQDRASWLPRLREAGVPVAAVRTVAEAFQSEEMALRKLVSHIPHPTAGEIPNIASPLRFGSTPVVPPRAAPTLGQHTRDVLADTLQYDSAKIGALEAAGVIRKA
ncbi:CoA transferase [Bradyrhizobium sp. LHD-71]|uniref:CaiB/BaiF CoA transferase family protein n=1 Tax=Bradyrhizobium sp. LHD-71 TaxID=3072141 RepID=UPI00280D8C88|nr:CoA transferase [Bradyrhizobium sp. LHD-71]MDQ8727106.1 CoA transferase [Bradyrhizobium sp. LHD-71]